MFSGPVTLALAVVLLGCSASGCGGRTADETSDEDGAPSCDGVLHQDICYRTRRLFETNAYGTELVSLGEDQTLALVGIGGDQLVIATWVGQADQPFEVRLHPLEHGGHEVKGVGDFVGDALERMIVIHRNVDWTTFDVIYTLDGDMPTGAPLVTSVRPAPMTPDSYWFLLGPVDLADGSSVMVAQDGYGMVGTFRLDVATKSWVAAAPVIEGPPSSQGNVVLDANRDGLRDLLVWGNADDSQAHVLISDGVGGVVGQDLGTPCELGDTGRIYVGDLTGDGAADLACREGNEVRLLANDGEGMFGSAVVLSPEPPGWGLHGIADMLGDGTNDLLLSSFLAQEDSFGFLPGPFADSNFVELGFDIDATGAVADFDNDGIDEIVVEISGDTHVIDPRRM